MYTAKVRLPQRRDVATGAPKVLLVDIYHYDTLLRDHAWVEETPELVSLRRSSRKDVVTISFEADTKPYHNHRSGEAKLTLTNLKAIKRIK